MKRILIVNKSFATGGIQSSMVNMANQLSKFYKVDILAYYPEGPMKGRLLPSITVISPPWKLKAIGMTFREAMRSKSLKIVLFRLFCSFWSKLFDNSLPLELAMKLPEKIRCEDGRPYDLAIAFHHEQRKKTVTAGFVRFVARCVVANKKAAWIHYDADSLDLDSSYNEPFYAAMDHIVAVSKSVMESFRHRFPALKEKTSFCYNYLDCTSLSAQSELPQTIEFEQNAIVFFSACRLTQEKGISRAIRAIAPILKRNQDIFWYIAGDGIEKENILQCIADNGVQQQIKIIGNQENPYSFMRNANAVMNVSFHEAAPMVFLEAAVLQTPVFATKTLSAEEMLHDCNGDFICENSEEGIRDKFEFLARNRTYLEEAKIEKKSMKPSGFDLLVFIKELL